MAEDKGILGDLVEVEQALVGAVQNAAEAGVEAVGSVVTGALELVRGVIEKVGGSK